jgi:hypothetical protein
MRAPAVPSNTASRHSRFSGKIGGIGITSGTGVARMTSFGRSAVPKKSASLIRDDARAAVVDLADDLVGRAIAELEAVHQGLGAEGAALVAPPGGLHERPVDVAVLLEQLVSRQRLASPT